MDLRSLTTPALVLDRSILEANLARMSERMKERGVDLRPHMKTAKCVEVARRAVIGHSGAITVSTAAEAHFFAAAGFTDITWAVCALPEKLDRVVPLLRRGIRLTLITDDVAVVPALSARARAAGVTVPLMVEVDSGGGRTGVEPATDEPEAVAEAIRRSSHLELTGVLTHGGQAYRARSGEDVLVAARQERRVVVDVAARLRARSLPCPRVSAGSTPTALTVDDLDGVTEMRPGVYVFQDLFQAAMGVCRRDDIALSVLATVVSRRSTKGTVVIDAGSLALSCDGSAAVSSPEVGYGVVVDIDGRPRWSGLHVVGLSQEHGIVSAAAVPHGSDELQPGTRVRVLPNHACITAACHDRYHVLEPAGRISGTWMRCVGW